MKFADCLYSEPDEPKTYTEAELTFADPAELLAASAVMTAVSGRTNLIAAGLQERVEHPTHPRYDLVVRGEAARQIYARVGEAASGALVTHRDSIRQLPEEVTAAAWQLYATTLPEHQSPGAEVATWVRSHAATLTRLGYTTVHARATRGRNGQSRPARAATWTRSQISGA